MTSGIARIDGTVAVVTGGASGIGLGIARCLAGEGAKVVIADVERAALRAASAELGAMGVETDVRDPAGVQGLADAVLERHGRVDIVVNNAGVGPFAALADLQPADWRWIIDVNLWGVINGISTFLPLLRANPNGGHIVNTASMAGLTPVPGMGAYSVTKFGVVALSETLAMELEGEPIGVTVLFPGFIRTNIASSTRNRPEGLEGALSDGELRVPGVEPRWLEIDDAGRIVVDAIRQGHLYAITHPELLPAVQQRHDRIVDAFRRLGVSP